uniref:Cnd3 domain-containing protein n=1 Tax=Heterorhabditis bacteriophora TaxID=37862 RepID=A0A1I7WYL2_HETBA
MDDSQEVQDILKMKQITVLETLEILRHLDRDTSGILLSDCSLSKEVTDRIMIDLAEAFYSSRADDLLSAVCEITAGVVHKVYNPDATLANETVSLPLNMTLRPIEMPELDEVTLHFCMQLTHSLLRTGIFNKFNALLRGVYDNVIDKCWSSTSAKVRVWALEAVAIIGMIDEDIARGKLPVIVEALSIDEIQVKMGCLDILTDLIIVHNYEKVMSWYSTADVETNRARHLIYYFVDIIKDTVADYSLCIKGCECACKILLAEPRGFKNKHWVDTVTSLIMRLCHPSASKNSYLKGCLAQFFPIFCTINRSNQLLLLSGFHNILAEVRISDAEDSFVAKVDIERATLFIINLTRFSVLQETAPGKNEGPVHRVLLSDILAYLSDHPEDGFVRIYCQATALLELDGIPLDEITNMQQGYQSLLDTFVDIVGSRSKSVTELKKLIRRIDTARKALNSKHIEISQYSEMDDAVCELPVISTLHTPIKTRKTPLSTSTPGTSKYKSRRKKMQSTIKKSVRQEAEEILASPYSPRSS